MKEKLRILLLEDNPADAALNERVLRKEGIPFESLRVETAPDFLAALETFQADIILADYHLPGFDGFKALAMVREKDSNLPFIFVSGVMGEECAVKSLHMGANDYILKDRLNRLPSAVLRALNEAEQKVKLVESEQRWKFALEGSGDGIWDRAGDTVFYSKRWKEMLGYQEEDIGSTLSEWDSRVHPDDKERCYADLEKHFRGETPFYKNEHRIRCKDGSYKWILDRGKVLSWTDDNKPSRVIGTLTDISQRKQAEEELKNKETRYRELINNMSDGVALYNAVHDGTDFVFRELNRAGEQIIGLTCEHAVGHTVTEIFPSVEEIGLLEVFRRVWKSGRPEFLGCKHYRDTHLDIWMENYIFKLPNNEIVAVFSDISTRKELEEQMLANAKMATIASLAAGVAHEINTPLSGILQSEQLLSQGLDPKIEQSRLTAEKHGVDLEKVQKYLQDTDLDFFLGGIRQSATRASTIIADLLQFSRPNTRESCMVNLSTLIDTSIDLSKTDYELKKKFNIFNVEFIRNYSPTLPEIPCVATEIEQVLINLIKNSCQAMIARTDASSPPRIVITAKESGDRIKIEVEDNGCGMTPEVRRQVFEPFFTTKDVGQGTGLGLAVCYSIICDKHGGSLGVTSDPGQGSRFFLSLPLREPEHKQATLKSEAQ